MQKNILEIVYLDPNELTPYENNSKIHSKEDIEEIKKSIEIDGFNDPIGIWGDNNLIVEGHGRQLAAIALGLEKVPCIRLDHMTDTQRRDYTIRHNRTTELSSWNFDMLEKEVFHLNSNGMDTDGLGVELFNPDDLKDVFFNVKKVPAKREKHKIVKCPNCGNVIEI